MRFLAKSLITGSAGLAMLAAAGLQAYADDTEMDVREEEEVKVEEVEEAEEEIVVTATRLATPAEQIGSSVSVITAEDMERRQIRTVYDALREIEGMHIRRQSGRGSFTSSSIRGLDNKHTKVMIDGIMVNDPAASNREFDFAHLTTDNVERIEVVRGNQSTLYGADAVGGVINIITKEGEGPLSGTVSSEYGSFDTSISRFSLGGAEGPLSYSFSGSYTDSRGISHRDAPPARDGYRNTTLGTTIGLQARDNVKIDFSYRFEDAMNEYDTEKTAYDSFWDSVTEAVDARSWTERHTVRSQATIDLADGLWEQIIGVGRSDTKRRNEEEGFENPPSGFTPVDEAVSEFRGKYTQVDWQHNLYIHELYTLTLGAEWAEEKADLDSRGGGWAPAEYSARRSTTSGFVQNQFEPVKNLFLTAGLRTDRHEEFGTETTYRLAGAYLISETDTRLRASHGTGFKAPSLENLYGPDDWGPNPDLDPEKSRSWDAGIEQFFFDRHLKAELTYFENDIRNLLQWTDGQMENVGKAETYGVETGLSAKITDSLTTRVGYTYTRAKDKETNEELLRRPKDRFTLSARYSFNDKASVTLTGHHVGRRYDEVWEGWTPERVRLGSYTLLNLAASHEIRDNVTVFARTENLLREDYEEVSGYNTPGRTFYAGLQARF